jgi:hypothetical protein
VLDGCSCCWLKGDGCGQLHRHEEARRVARSKSVGTGGNGENGEHGLGAGCLPLFSLLPYVPRVFLPQMAPIGADIDPIHFEQEGTEETEGAREATAAET